MSETILRAVIVEDEEESLQLLENLLVSSGLAEVADSTTNPDDAIDRIVIHRPDMVFIDIKMPGKNGFEVLDDLNRIRSVNPYIVFTTAYDEFALKAFDYAAFDYLLKPVEPGRLAETLRRCLGNMAAGRSQNKELLLSSYKKLIYRNISGIVVIDPAEIIYVKAEGNYSIFRLSTGRSETVTQLIGKVEEQLDDERFFRTGRTCIINLDHLKRVNSLKHQCILIHNGSEFECEIARNRIKALSERLREING
jgi:two-component system, LytTR family, response regulator